MTSFNKFTRLVVQKAAIEKSFVLGHAAVLADIGMNRLQNVARPTNLNDAATKGYVDDLIIGSDGGGINVLDPPALAFTDTDMRSYNFNFASGKLTVSIQMVGGALTIDNRNVTMLMRVLLVSAPAISTGTCIDGLYIVTSINTDASNSGAGVTLTLTQPPLLGDSVLVTDGEQMAGSSWVYHSKWLKIGKERPMAANGVKLLRTSEGTETYTIDPTFTFGDGTGTSTIATGKLILGAPSIYYPVMINTDTHATD